MAAKSSIMKQLVLFAVLLLTACSGVARASVAREPGSASAADSVRVSVDTVAVSADAVSAAPEEAPALAQEDPTATAEPPPAEPSPTPTVEPTTAPEDVPINTPTATPTPLPVSIESGTAEMLLAAGGEFIMGGDADELLEICNSFRTGCDPEWFSWSEPVHLVQIAPFYIDLYEVTNEAFLEFANELGDLENACGGEDCIDFENSRIEEGEEAGTFTVPDEFADHPVVGVNWYAADAFCDWRDARLPTEAEWELAASWDAATKTKTLYPWGDEFDGTVVNFCDASCVAAQAETEVDDGFPNTAPVGSFPDGRSPSGNYDLGGNAWEWVNDWFDADYYAESAQVNPTGPVTGETKVVRGGSWFDTGNFTSGVIRFPAPPTEFSDTIGFRCALNALTDEEIAAQAPPPTAEPEEVEATEEPTAEPTATATVAPTNTPTATATVAPTTTPAATATNTPTATSTPTATATTTPTATATATAEPTTTGTPEATATATAEATVAPDADADTDADVDTGEAAYENCAARPGQDLGHTYIVGNCDWLSRIAERLGISYHALLAANPEITNPDIIYPGQILQLPPRASMPGAQPGASGPPPAGAPRQAAPQAPEMPLMPPMMPPKPLPDAQKPPQKGLHP